MRIRLILLFVTLNLLVQAPLSAQQTLIFTENKGQWNSRIRYAADIPSGKLCLESKGFNYIFADGKDLDVITHSHFRKTSESPVRVHYHSLRTEFEGSNPSAFLKGEVALDHYSNFFLGNDPKHWASKVKSYYRVKYKEVYKGIDLSIYSGEHGLKYDWIIQPGADPSQISVNYQGAENMYLHEGRLIVQLSFSSLIENVPHAYQFIGDEQVSVNCRFVLKGNTLSYELGTYNKSYPLIIDPPVLVFATYSGSTADNFGFTATYDSRGNLYAAGNVRSHAPLEPNRRYPATPGAFQQTFAGQLSSHGPYDHFPCDMAISKYDSSGSQLIWATYLGGTDNDYPHSLVVDKDEQLIILGSTYSADFPKDTFGYDTTHNGSADIVVVKLSKDASRIAGATFLGGGGDDGILGGLLVHNYADDFRGDIFVDLDKQIYLASCTNSGNGYPTTSDRLNDTGNAGYDGVISVLDSSLHTLVWSTRIGGELDDALYSLKMNRRGEILASGGTRSTMLRTTPQALHPNFLGGVSDGMALKIDFSTRKVKALTYFGTSGYDQVYFIDYDLKNHVYLHGQTTGNISHTPGVYGQASRGQFIVKLDEELDSVLFATTIGIQVNQPDLSPTAFLVDNCYNIYFAGWGSDGVGGGGTTTNLPITPDAKYPNTDGHDFYLAVLNKDAQSLIYATFFGGTQTKDHVDGGTSRFDKKGVVYHSICGSCPGQGDPGFITDINTTASSAFPTNLSPRCSNAAFKFDFNITYAVEAIFTASPKSGCSPLQVNFTNLSEGTQFLWDFGDGSTDTSYNPKHTYTAGGTYTVWLKVIDSVSCNFKDSMSTTIVVFDGSEADFTFTNRPCTTLVELAAGNSPANTYRWIFSDSTTSTLKNPEHVFSEYGDHSVMLITNPGTVCADTVVKTVSLTQPGTGTLRIPNIFTPNGDALNACYQYPGLESCDRLKIEIFNRWAEKVYESDDPMFCWDGTDYRSHQPVPDGVYFVVATIEQMGKPPVDYKGVVTIVR